MNIIQNIYWTFEWFEANNLRSTKTTFENPQKSNNSLMTAVNSTYKQDAKRTHPLTHAHAR